MKKALISFFTLVTLATGMIFIIKDIYSKTFLPQSKQNLVMDSTQVKNARYTNEHYHRE
jgi:hypothetical protein